MVGNTANCEQVWREISTYVDGNVDAAQRASMEEHFQSCKRCTSVLAGMRNVIRLYGDERMLEVPAGFSGRLQKRLAKNTAVQGRRWSSWSAWLVPVAAMVLITGTLLMTSSSRSPLKSQHAEPAKDIPPDMAVVVSSGAKVFHVAGCPFIHDKSTERTLTAKEAMQQGYVPCSRCLRQYLKTWSTHRPGAQVADDVGTEAGDEQEEVLSAAGH